ncbi:MAG: hypothetical protein LBU27_03705 [Candidatus Peribacteria bacterium]|nr:hypothetical protein [Candidatus Peribacteria bacterium]
MQSSHPLSQTLRQQGITPEKVERLIATKKMMDTSENGQPSAF